MVPAAGLAPVSSAAAWTYSEYSAQRGFLISLRRYHYQGSSWVEACQVCSATLFSPTQEQFSGRSRVWGRRGRPPVGPSVLLAL